MFDGMAEQFYQFLAATTAASTTTPTHITSSLPLSFTLHTNTPNTTTNTNTNNGHHHFSTYSSSSSHHQPQPCYDAAYHHLLHQHHPHFLPRNDDKNDDDASHDDEEVAAHHQRSVTTMFMPEIPWSNDEMLALFRIRSSVDNTWFPDFIWETVSRKLAEVGFKRSAEKCKQKFEEETRSFNSSSIISNCNTKNNHNHNHNHASNGNNNYRLFHELEELCNNNNNNDNYNNNNNNTNTTINGENDHGNPLLHPPLPLAPDEREHLPQPSLSRKDQCLRGGDDGDGDINEDNENDLRVDEEDNKGGESVGGDGNGENNKNDVGEDEDEQSVGDSEKTEENTKKRVMRKRKRQKKFEMFKGFCEKIVNEMMAQQQQLHCKILQDMVKRDEEKIAKEEAWKRQEIERLEKELEVRAHEQAIAGDRQAKIFDFLNKFSSTNNNTSSTSSNVMDVVSHHQSLKETLEKLNKVPNFTCSNNSSILSQDSIISAAQLQQQQQPTSSCTTHDDDNHTPLVMDHQACPNIPGSSSNENLALLSSIRLENSKLAPPMSSPPSMDQTPRNPNHAISHDDSPSPRPPSMVSSSQKFSKSDHTSTNATECVTEFKTLEDHNNDMTPVARSGKDDTGRRWPRDEVLALINIRCSLFNNNNNNNNGGGGGGDAHNDKEGFSKGPLWERISQKMTELGYKRSAKRCKEKWENINKYFRKTKDMNKKRSIDSRTCPYFHQLSHLYSQGTLVGPTTDRPISLPNSPETRSMAFSGTTHQGGSTTAANEANNAMHTSQGNEGSVVVQVPGFDFEF